MVFMVKVSSILGSYLVFLDLFHVCTCVCVCAHVLSDVWLFVTPWTIAHQAPLSTMFSKQGYCSSILYPRTKYFLTQGLNPHLLCLLHWQANSLHCATWEAPLVWFSPLNMSHINTSLRPAREPRKIEDNFFFLLSYYFFYSHGMIMFKSLVSCHYEHSFLSCCFSLYMNSMSHI